MNPPPPHLGTFENQDVAVTVRRGISKRSHEKIGDCEQSMLLFREIHENYASNDELCQNRSTAKNYARPI